MSAPDLCDGCLAERAWCLCVVAAMSPIPATGGRTIRGRVRHRPSGGAAPERTDPDAGHDPGDEHRDPP